MYMNDEEEHFRFSISRFESMLKSNKILFFDSEEFENIILHYVDSGKLNLAKKALKLGLEQHPHSIGLKLVKIEVLVFEDKLDEAERLVTEIRQVDPTNEEVFIQQANIQSKKGFHEKAIESLNVALQYTEDLADVYSLMGMEYLYMDQLEQARYYFKKCIDNDPEDQSALYNIIYCYDFLDQSKDAVVFLEEYIDENPYSEVAWHQLGRQYVNIQEYEKAVDAFDFATIIDESFLGAILEKGKAYEQLKKFKKAIVCYNEALEIDPNSAYVYWRIGSSYEALNKNKRALKYFLRAVHEDPMLDKGWIAITDLFIKTGNFQKALFYVNKALNIDEQNKLYWRRYAIINKELFFMEDAEYGFKKAIEFGDLFIDTWLFWADTLQYLGKPDNAIQHLLKANEMFPNEYELEYRLAGLYFMLDETQQGAYHLSNAMHNNFKNIDLFKNLFPVIWENPLVQKYIQEYKKASGL